MNLKDTQVKASEDNQYLPISDAAALLHVHPETLRRYEAKGFIESQKTAGGHRRYSSNDISNLKENINNGCLKSENSSKDNQDNNAGVDKNKQQLLKNDSDINYQGSSRSKEKDFFAVDSWTYRISLIIILMIFVPFLILGNISFEAVVITSLSVLISSGLLIDSWSRARQKKQE
jgi:DNA-binding transcriptional MerR regulator